jgi:PAS domain S-box-containing protein
MAQVLTSTEYRLLVEHAPVMVWRAGPDASCDYFNETWLSFTGRTLEQEMGNGWAEGVHPDDFDRCLKHYLEHFQRRAAFEMEYRLRRHDGEYRWIFDRGVPFTDDAGALGGFIGSCVDIDQRRRTQHAREQRDQAQLALAREFEQRILAIVSHDIRNPLSTIKNTAQVLQFTADRADQVDRHAQTVLRAAKRIEHMVSDLLDLSRERQGAGISIEPKPIDLRVMCGQIVDEMGAVARGREITFDCEVDGLGAWDEDRIQQAISNLTSNAVQHGAPGSPVHLRLTGDEQRVAVEVQNQGTIPDEARPSLFEPFHTTREYTKRGEGLGLGLFIAKAIARAHGGGLEFDSSGDTTTFRLVLPRHTPSGVDSRPAGPM